ncbi:MAG: hypothetical protein IPF59_08985 [Ignavibacteria bacterium]|nr:hypothetical protein [Ignavibacteria bacterium]
MNFAVVIVTIALGYIAWRAYQVSQDQLKSLAVDQNRQLLERTLAAAIADFTKRLDSNRDDKVNKLTNTNAFLKAYERCIDYQVDEVKLAADERYQSFRTANYILKPLKYWCVWVESSGLESSGTLKSDLTAGAYRMLASMTSPCQVYLLMANELQLHSLEGTSSGYVRGVSAHEPIYRFIAKYAESEIEDCKQSNAGQTRKVIDLIRSTKWKSDRAVREGFFVGKTVSEAPQQEGAKD